MCAGVPLRRVRGLFPLRWCGRAPGCRRVGVLGSVAARVGAVWESAVARGARPWAGEGREGVRGTGETGRGGFPQGLGIVA